MTDLITPSDVARLVPRFSFGDAFIFAAQALLGVFLVGESVRRKLRLSTRFPVERNALAGVIGLIVICLVAWCLFAVAHNRTAVQAGLYALEIGCLISYVKRLVKEESLSLDSLQAEWKLFRPTRGELCGGFLIGVLVVYYLARTVPLFDFDGERLRLYGAAFSDKTTNMMSCHALMHDVPPDCLRFAGRKFPSHYFPHLYTSLVDPFSRPGGNRIVADFWFYVPTLGIVINGLAILAFGRRVLKSYAAGCVGLVIYGLSNVSPELKPLDVTPALAIMALIALDRYRKTDLKRWAVVAIALVGAMPCFETFHASLMVAALGLWGGLEFVAAWLRRRRSGDRLARLPRWVLVVPATAGIAAIVSLQMLYLGERPVAPPKLKFDSVFGDSYRNTWEARARDDDRLGRTLAGLDHWKRKPKPTSKPSDAKSEEQAAPVAWYQRATAKAIYTIGVPIYVFFRFVHIASLGAVHLWRRRRARSLRPSELVIAAAAFIGFTLPWLIDVGTTADGKWWSSPNLYRPTEFGATLLTLLGAGVMLELATHLAAWKRPAIWLLAGVAGYWLVAVAENHLAPTTTYLEVSAYQLKALSYLRNHTPYDAITVHPWSDCAIRDAADGDKISFVYKRHFTLGSNLAGRTMYYEGREDYTFSNGFIEPEEVYRRSRARKTFYPQREVAADPKSITALLNFETSDGRRIEYVVADAEFPAPPIVRESWPVVFLSGDVAIRRRPD